MICKTVGLHTLDKDVQRSSDSLGESYIGIWYTYQFLARASTSTCFTWRTVSSGLAHVNVLCLMWTSTCHWAYSSLSWTIGVWESTKEQGWAFSSGGLQNREEMDPWQAGPNWMFEPTQPAPWRHHLSRKGCPSGTPYLPSSPQWFIVIRSQHLTGSAGSSVREFPSEDCDLFLLGKECHLEPPDAEGYGG